MLCINHLNKTITNRIEAAILRTKLLRLKPTEHQELRRNLHDRHPRTPPRTLEDRRHRLKISSGLTVRVPTSPHRGPNVRRAHGIAVQSGSTDGRPCRRLPSSRPRRFAEFPFEKCAVER